MPDIPFPANMSQIVAQRPVRKEAMPTTPATSTKAMSDFFAAFSNEGQKWYGLLKEREAEDQFRQAQVDTMEMFSSYQQNLLENPDTADTDLSIFNKVMGESLQQTKQNLTNGKAAREFGFWIEPQRIRMSDWAAKNAFASSTRIAEDQEIARVTEGLRDAAVVRDDSGNPVLDENGLEKFDWNIPAQIIADPKFQRETGLSFKQLDGILEDVQSFANTQKKTAEAVTDPEVYWDMLRKVTKDPKRVTEDEIAELVTKGLTTDDYKELLKIKEARGHPLKTPRAQIYLDDLKRLYDETILTTLEYDQKNEKLMEYLETNPAAQEVHDFYFDELVGPEKKNFLDKLWERAKPFGTWSGYGIYKRMKAKKKEVKEEPYTIGETRPDASGQEWEYIGDDKWRKK